jgi:adenylate cyclase
MPFEIERKFLVRGDAWRAAAIETLPIRQAYLAIDGKASVRLRIKRDSATLPIKSRTPELRRLELEYPIPVIEAEAAITLRRGLIVEKDRHLVPHAGMTWEIDEFHRENEGLIIAEIELRDADQRFDLPPWAGPEVTSQPQFYNSALSVNPFVSWSCEQKFAMAR